MELALSQSIHPMSVKHPVIVFANISEFFIDGVDDRDFLCSPALVSLIDIRYSQSANHVLFHFRVTVDPPPS